MDARKEGTRRKIQLGGLVIKAGMADHPPVVLLGALALAANALAGPNAHAMRERFAAAGDALFSNDRDDSHRS